MNTKLLISHVVEYMNYRDLYDVRT